jgi:uncharacterized membrane protein
VIYTNKTIHLLQLLLAVIGIAVGLYILFRNGEGRDLSWFLSASSSSNKKLGAFPNFFVYPVLGSIIGIAVAEIISKIIKKN